MRTRKQRKNIYELYEKLKHGKIENIIQNIMTIFAKPIFWLDNIIDKKWSRRN